ncbi:major outer membrane protein [Helicobacter rodentium]|uniref:major outer membrane protein n=1 Tax=Helicobacter rodentium TaxID=59617 RepID=UPI00047E931B|nr:major outer membrane protein [Helicobacter rodentium]
MKFLKLSLAASVALGAFSTASFAQPLEEAIRGIDVSGYLRYRYNDDRYSDAEFHKNEVDGPKSKSKATHRWKAVADFKTPVVNNIGLNFGILYNNESNNVNHGNNYPGTGDGLGSGKDGSFGVSTFYATIAPDSTATTILIGKQRLATPVTNAGDDDRGTGILALNSDITGLTLAAGAFDSWSIDDVQKGYTSGNNDGASATKPLYVLAGIYGVDTAYGRFGGQLWGFYIQDAVDALGVGELTWDGSTFNAALQYALAKLDNSDSSLLGALNGKTLVGTKSHANIAEANDLFVFNVGADFANDFGVPLDVKLGYVTNFQDGTAVTLNDDGTIFKYAGALWWQNNATGISTSALGVNSGVHGFGTEQSIDVFYVAVGYRMVDERLRIGLDYVWGNNDVAYANRSIGTGTKRDIDFQEITPRFSWKHNANLTISGYYAYLMTDAPDRNQADYLGDNLTSDEDRQRVRLEVKYSF